LRGTQLSGIIRKEAGPIISLPPTGRSIIMSKRCPDCGSINDDSRIYCASCGEPLDADLRLIQDLSAKKKAAPVKEEFPDEPEPAPIPKKDNEDDGDLGKLARKKKFNPVPWILLAVGVVVVIVGIMILTQ